MMSEFVRWFGHGIPAKRVITLGDRHMMHRVFDDAWRAYHAGNLKHAEGLLRSQPSPESKNLVLMMKILVELDRPADALRCFEQHDSKLKTGEAYYWAGVASYLAGNSLGAVTEAFSISSDRGFAGSGLGQAFLCFVRGQHKSAQIHLEETGCFGEPEYEHIRQQIRFQVACHGGHYEDAKDALESADALLTELSSPLRGMWGDVCWVRYWRSVRKFERAQWLALKIQRRAPADAFRLRRNIAEALRHISKENAAGKLALPTVSELNQRAGDNGIKRKPTLASMFEYLQSRGAKGASKEMLADVVWGEPYNPLVHDDRIYKSIGRLRSILRDDRRDPRILIQRGDAYLLSVHTQSTSFRA